MKLKSIILMILGLIFLAVGAIGVFIPIWPTTPFVIVGAGCLSSTPKIHSKIMKVPFFNEHIENYKSKKGLSKKNLIVSLTFLWSMLIISMLLMKKVWLTALLIFIGTAVTIHILWVSTDRSKNKNDILKTESTGNRKRFFGYIEVVFDILYLIIALLIGIYLLNNISNKIDLLAGIMALVLVGGDSFHLIPRIIAILTNDTNKLQSMLGFGKFITSITMTIFYLILWQIGLLIFPYTVSSIWTIIIYGLATIRIILCLFPQNRWLDKNPPINWGVIRNIPFMLIGLITVAFYGINSIKVADFKYMWLAVLLSFVFYVPVVLWGQKKPKLGMLMLPKSCMYIWILFMFT